MQISQSWFCTKLIVHPCPANQMNVLFTYAHSQEQQMNGHTDRCYQSEHCQVS